MKTSDKTLSVVGAGDLVGSNIVMAGLDRKIDRFCNGSYIGGNENGEGGGNWRLVFSLMQPG